MNTKLSNELNNIDYVDKVASIFFEAFYEEWKDLDSILKIFLKKINESDDFKKLTEENVSIFNIVKKTRFKKRLKNLFYSKYRSVSGMDKRPKELTNAISDLNLVELKRIFNDGKLKRGRIESASEKIKDQTYALTKKRENTVWNPSSSNYLSVEGCSDVYGGTNSSNKEGLNILENTDISIIKMCAQKAAKYKGAKTLNNLIDTKQSYLEHCKVKVNNNFLEIYMEAYNANLK